MVLKLFQMSFPHHNILFGSDYIFLTQDITRVKNLLTELEGAALKMERLYLIKRMAKGNTYSYPCLDKISLHSHDLYII